MMTRLKPHKYRPFTTRDVSAACAECRGGTDSEEHRLGEISDEFIEAVEDECGMGRGAWDMVLPQEIILAVLKVAPKFLPKKE